MKDKDNIIAKFMGGEIISTEEYEMPHGSYSTGIITHWKSPKGIPYGNEHLINVGSFRYSFDYNWLMPVVEEIESLGYNSCIELVSDNTHRVTIYSPIYGEIGIGGKEDSKIQAIYSAVIDFIEWYNINKKLSDLLN